MNNMKQDSNTPTGGPGDPIRDNSSTSKVLSPVNR
jgi:hypothetical protein